jgi:4-amino-4-deoxy-L-arabinose transferase-like glycosyltransferase
MPANFFDTGSTDYTKYSVIARDLVGGRKVDLSTDIPAIGFPILIALVNTLSASVGITPDLGMRVFSLIGMGIVSVLVFVLARLVWDVSRALVAALLWMAYPFGLWLTRQPNSEIPFLVFFYAGLGVLGYSLTSQHPEKKQVFCAGILLGLATLIRPASIGISLLVAAALCLVIRDRPVRWRLLMGFVLVMGNLTALFPWEAWVYSEIGEVVPVSTVGASSMRDGLTFAVAHKDYRQALSLPDDVSALMQNAAMQKDQLQSTKDIALFLADEIRVRPQAVLGLLAIKAVRSWYGTDSQRFEILSFVIQSLYLGLASAGVCLAWQKRKTTRPLIMLLGVVVLYFWAVTIMVLSILRYMIPAMGLLFIAIPGVLPDTMSKNVNSE